jgi:hypothetical protein
MLYFASRSAREVFLIEQVVHADHEHRSVKINRGGTDGVWAAERTLAAAVLAASDHGLSWQTIGDALGMRRGAAYQRFRRRPSEGQLAERHSQGSRRLA